MALKSHKAMPELSMLTILIQVASIIKNEDGDGSLQGYMQNLGVVSRKVMDRKDLEMEFALLDSINDTLVQKNQVLAISPDKRTHASGAFKFTILTSTDPEQEHPAELPISEHSTNLKVSSINATVVPNPNDRRGRKYNDGQSGGPLGNIREVIDGSSCGKRSKWIPCIARSGE